MPPTVSAQDAGDPLTTTAQVRLDVGVAREPRETASTSRRGMFQTLPASPATTTQTAARRPHARGPAGRGGYYHAMVKAGLHEEWGSDINLRSGAQMREYKDIADRIAADGPGRLLDWGCGWGQVSDLLHRRGIDVSSFEYRGDVDEPRLEPLERFPHLAAFVSSEPVALPYEDAAFDSVLSCGVLEHVHDPDGSLEEIRRVLRPGGTFYVFKLPNRLSWLEWVAKRAGMYYHGSLPNDRVYTRRSALALLERHGFAVREVRRANMLPLTLPGALSERVPEGLMSANRALSRVPALNLLSTNLELVARRSP
jgi:ubiquinone/menaquinone biosynthesis C-methylase UbiE